MFAAREMAFQFSLWSGKFEFKFGLEKGQKPQNMHCYKYSPV